MSPKRNSRCKHPTAPLSKRSAYLRRTTDRFQDSQVVVRYILSRAMVDELDKSIDLRGKFSQADYLSRFDPVDPIEKLEKYWRKRVDATVDMMSGIVSFQIRAFTPADSLVIAKKVIELSEKLVNELSTRTRRDAVSQTQAEVARAEARLKSATATMRDARNSEGVLDAPAAADAINKVLTQLRLDLATTEENLASLTVERANAAVAADAPARRARREPEKADRGLFVRDRQQGRQDGAGESRQRALGSRNRAEIRRTTIWRGVGGL